MRLDYNPDVMKRKSDECREQFLGPAKTETATAPGGSAEARGSETPVVGDGEALIAENLKVIEASLMHLVASVRNNKLRRNRDDDPLSIVKREQARKERNFRALKLRRTGKTYREVGAVFGVGNQRAAQMCAWAERHERWYGGAERLANEIAGESIQAERP